MDYTDDACSVCDGRIIVGLEPGATYRVAAMPEVCGAPLVLADRVFSYAVKADAQGTSWNPRRAVTFRGSALPRSIHILKGRHGTTEVACGDSVDLTDQVEHPFAGRPVSVARFTGAERRGLVIAVALPLDRARITTVLANIPGRGQIRVRGTDRGCGVGAGAGAVTLTIPALAVNARHTASRTETVDNNETISVGSNRSMRLGASTSRFAQVRCVNAIGLVTIEG